MPEVIAMSLFPQPPVGFPVVWYPQANAVKKNAKQAAVVTSSGEKGRVCLTVFGKASMPRPINDCTHVICPTHKKRPMTTLRNGGWDFVEGMGPEMYFPPCKDLEQYLRLVVPHGQTQEEDRLRQRVLSLYGQRLELKEISQKLGIEMDEVSQIVKELIGGCHGLSESEETEFITKEEAAKLVEQHLKNTPARKAGRPRKETAQADN